MSNNSLQPDSDALHQSAIDVITHVSNVMSEGCAILRDHDRLLAENQGGNRLGAEIKAIEEDISHVNEKLERVKRKELTMTIVAPTSAGKSTIINAIAGQEMILTIQGFLYFSCFYNFLTNTACPKDWGCNFKQHC
ncbi:hypothetical protein ACOWPH_06675 [Anabaena sp. PCC 7938]|uniref:G domain-containing protein n=1 Tax=Anabaena cylindrica (strain ATCC 27899 / PCC 7122) TaxID=272123 RepID=K9ZFN7_ANACC|nr:MULTISPECIES: hypothetical protein [Anabaena]AFZ58006.1 hypothetical protein Anacy_2563 [Anabaena cylindrica PCC 7122]MCM2408233.1 hypothetical protein [Anabaena sp. CCAP 1446/1C]BAY05030.1 hypothetical protein NIES19_42990 [Anabaena cylindrica PCC 7122]